MNIIIIPKKMVFRLARVRINGVRITEGLLYYQSVQKVVIYVFDSIGVVAACTHVNCKV